MNICGQHTFKANRGFGGLLSLSLAICILALPTQAQNYGGGTGTPQYPYLIYDPNHMQAIGTNPDDWDKHFKLMDDIDLSAYTGTQFNIIGWYENSDDNELFTGVFDGNGHTISNFTYSSAGANYIGLFGYVAGEAAAIRDLGLISPDINCAAGTSIGALAGHIGEGTISDCYVKGGTITGNKKVGALVGRTGEAAVSRCFATCDVTGNGWGIGGLIGIASDTTISACYATGNVTADQWGVGGLVGHQYHGQILTSYATGPVRGTDWGVGGLLGNGEGVYIAYSYAAGNVTGVDDVGGLVGYYCHGEILASFWDTLATGQVDGIGYDEKTGTVELYGRTTAQMRQQATFTDYGWDFIGEDEIGTDDIWRMCVDGVVCPRFPWQFIVGDFFCPDGVTLIDFSFFAERWFNDNCGTTNDCDRTDLDFSDVVDVGDLRIFSNLWLARAGETMAVDLTLDNTWMYQNLPTTTTSNLTANVSIIDDQYNNTSYTHDWEIILPDDVSIAPAITDSGVATDTFCTFTAPNCNEPNGISNSGQPFTVRVTVIGADFGNIGTAGAQFGIALLGDANNDTVVNVADRSIINAFWRLGAAGSFTFKDCDINCDGAVNLADRSIANAIWRGVLGRNRVTQPCPLR